MEASTGIRGNYRLRSRRSYAWEPRITVSCKRSGCTEHRCYVFKSSTLNLRAGRDGIHSRRREDVSLCRTEAMAGFGTAKSACGNTAFQCNEVLLYTSFIANLRVLRVESTC